MDVPLETIIVVHIIHLSFFINSLAGAATATLQGLEIMEFISISSVVSKAFNAVVGIGLLLLGYRVFAVALVYVGAAAILLLAQLYFLHRYRPLSLGFERSQVWPMLRASAPYVASAAVIVAYSEINVLTIGAMMSVTEAGWYGAAVRLFSTLLFFPVAYTTALFPQLTRTYHSHPDLLGTMFRKGLDLTMLVGVPVGLGLFAIAKPLVALFYGAEYAPTGPVLEVFGITLIWMYLNVLLGQYFTAIDRQNTWTAIIGLSGVLMTLMTVQLVPVTQQYFGNGALGGALSLCASEFLMVSVGMVLFRREFSNRHTLWTQMRIIVAGLLMVAVALSLSNAPIVMTVVASGLTYCALIALLRVLPKDDITMLLGYVGALSLRLRSLRSNATGAASD